MIRSSSHLEHVSSCDSGIKTSVAMCTYNGSRYLAEQLDSIAKQTEKPGELVICDDGSTDETSSIISRFSQRVAFPVRFYSNSINLGPAKNFEQAIRMCRGAIIILSDQDDIWVTTRVSALTAAFSNHPEASYVFSDGHMVSQDGKMLNLSLWEGVSFIAESAKFAGINQLVVLLKRNVVTGATMAVRASFRDSLLPIPDAWMHDYWIATIGSILTYGVALPEKLIKYRRHDAQVCGWKKKTFRQVYRDSIETNVTKGWDKLDDFNEILRRVRSGTLAARCPKQHLNLLIQKERHLIVRSKVRSSSRAGRLLKVLLEVVKGRYQRFTEGWFYSVMRDL